MASELGVEVGGIPVLPGFGKAAIHNPYNGSASDLQRLTGVGVKEGRGPVHADAVAFGEGNDWRDTKLGELRAKLVVEGGKFVGAAVVAGAVVKDGGGRKEFEDSFAAGLVPDFFEPAMDEHFILFESGKRLGSGRHAYLQKKMSAEYTQRGRRVEEWNRQPVLLRSEKRTIDSGP